MASDGGIFSFGNAGFYGSMGGQPLSKPIVGIASTPNGGGYWEVASDGGIFSFGNAPFRGSMGGQPLTRPVVAIAVGPLAFGNGTWVIGKNIPAATYHTQGTNQCYWERDKNFDGTLSSINANDIVVGPDIVTVLGSDAAFKSDGCDTWTLMYTSGPQATSFSHGVFAVGIDIAPGTYSTAGASGCYWARLSDFTGNLSGIIANGNPSGPATVTIAASDAGFKSQGCGTWTRQS